MLYYLFCISGKKNFTENYISLKRVYILCVSDKLYEQLYLTHADLCTHSSIQLNLSADTCKDASLIFDTNLRRCTQTRASPIDARNNRPMHTTSALRWTARHGVHGRAHIHLRFDFKHNAPPILWFSPMTHTPIHIQVLAGSVIMCLCADTVHNHLRIQRDTIYDGGR